MVGVQGYYPVTGDDPVQASARVIKVSGLVDIIAQAFLYILLLSSSSELIRNVGDRSAKTCGSLFPGWLFTASQRSNIAHGKAPSTRYRWILHLIGSCLYRKFLRSTCNSTFRIYQSTKAQNLHGKVCLRMENTHLRIRT
jgi:hypothetical protein